MSEGLFGSMTKNQEVRESMTFLGTSKTWSSLCSEGEVESGKRWYQANCPRSLGFILESVRASITGFLSGNYQDPLLSCHGSVATQLPTAK